MAFSMNSLWLEQLSWGYHFRTCSSVDSFIQRANFRFPSFWAFSSVMCSKTFLSGSDPQADPRFFVGTVREFGLATHSTDPTSLKPTHSRQIRKPLAGRALPGPVSLPGGVIDPGLFSCYNINRRDSAFKKCIKAEYLSRRTWPSILRETKFSLSSLACPPLIFRYQIRSCFGYDILILSDRGCSSIILVTICSLKAV